MPKVRFPIAAKILSIAGLLILIMVLVSIFSLRQMRKVSGEVDLLAGYYMSLFQKLTNIDEEALEQELHTERALKAVPSAKWAKQLDGEIAAMKKRMKMVDNHFIELHAVFDELKKKNLPVEDLIEMNRVSIIARELEKEHADFEKHAVQLMQLVKKKNTQKAIWMQELLQQEEDEFDEKMDALTRELGVFVKASSAKTADHEHRLLILVVIITFLAIVLGLLAAYVITRKLVKPMHALVQATYQVAGGNLDTNVNISTSDEIHTLGESFNRMIQEIRLKEQIKDTFGKYIDPRIVDQLIGDEKTGQGNRQVMTVFFSDVADFTSISEKLTAPLLVNLINAYLSAMSKPIHDSHGVIDKYIGDAIMAYWGAPFCETTDQAKLACTASLAQMKLLAGFKKQIPDILGVQGIADDFHFRIGIATGDLVIGNVGSETSRGYTVMGDTVNLASRLEGINKQYGTTIIVSQKTFEMAGGNFAFRQLDSINVKGKSEPVIIHELQGFTAETDSNMRRLAEKFETALKSYRQQDWHGAETLFGACLELKPDDYPSRLFLERIAHLKKEKPPADWDGTWKFTTK